MLSCNFFVNASLGKWTGNPTQEKSESSSSSTGNWRPRRSMRSMMCSSGSKSCTFYWFKGLTPYTLHIPFIYPSYTLLITLALFFFFKWWDKIVQCLTAAGYSGVMPGYSGGGASLSLDKRALCREIAWRLAKDPKVGHVVVSLRLFGLGSSIVEGGGRVVGKSSWMLCVDSATIPSGHRMSGYLKSSVRWILRACQGHFRYHDFPMASDPRTQELGRTEPFWVTFPSHCISWDSIPSGQTLPNS